MKKRLALLTVLLLMLIGCGERTEEIKPEPDPAPEQVVQESEAVEPPEELDWKAFQVTENCYDLSQLPEVAELTITGAGLIGRDKALFLTGTTGDSLHVLDLETGELTLLCQLELETEIDQNWADTALVCCDPIAVQDYQNDVTYIIRQDGTIRSQLEDSAYRKFGQERSVRCTDSGILYQTDYASGTEQTLCSLPTDYLYPWVRGYTADDAGIVLEVTAAADDAEVTLVINAETGEIAACYAGWDLYETLSGAVTLSAVNDGGEYDIQASSTFTITAERGSLRYSQTLDLNELSPDGEADLTSDWVYCESQQQFWGRGLISLWLGDECSYLLWDFVDEEPEQSEPRTLTRYEPVVYDMGEMSQRAAELSEQYGIEIHVGQAVTAAPFPDYTLSACTSTENISAGLDVLEEAFSVYPEGYLEQLGGDSIREICFYLSGTMTPNDPAVSIENPAGLSCQINGMELIALNVEGYIRSQDVIHELNHVLDHWLWEEAVLDEEVWSAMNPEDFDYYNAYVDENGTSYEFSGSTTYTTWDDPAYEGQVDTIYFVDPYSTTYPTEDRARLMEYLLMDPESYVPSLYESVHVQEKLAYYFQCIRQIFDTTGWPEETLWESRLAEAAARRE